MTLKEKLTKYGKVYSFTRIAQAADLSVGTVWRFAQADVPDPKISTVRAIARALGVDPLWLMNDDAGWPPVTLGRPGIEELAEVA